VRLTDEIGAFAGLVGLLLALATLLTAQRSTALDRLHASPRPTVGEATREALLDGGLAVVTGLVFLAGLPLWARAAKHLHPLASDGALRSVFMLSWILLLALIAWQLILARSAWRLRVRIAAAALLRGP
jgi:sterol desaturase/sphingolipid hydroxylase (fatty acid hydroxylase superfamily)